MMGTSKLEGDPEHNQAHQSPSSAAKCTRALQEELK